MNRYYSSRARCNKRFHFRWINIVCVGIDIAENWRNLLPLQRMCRGNEGE